VQGLSFFGACNKTREHIRHQSRFHQVFGKYGGKLGMQRERERERERERATRFNNLKYLSLTENGPKQKELTN